MLNHFIYDNFSMAGIYDAYDKNYEVKQVNGLIKFPNDIGKGYLQGLKIPGGIEILFAEYDYTEDIILEHLPENEQRFALWLDCANSNFQEFTYNNKIITQVEAKQQQAYLMNSIFPYKQFRTKGTKGISVTIFIPPYLLSGFLKENEYENILGKFYEFQCKGLALVKLPEEAVQKLNSLFYQWNKYKNIVSITKYTYQLLEWYFLNLINYFNDEKIPQKLFREEAIDLTILEKYIQQSVSFLTPDIYSAELKITTPIKKLKQLFESLHAKTIDEYFKAYKMKKAMQELTSTNKNIAEIAYEYGYANPSNFSAFFKKHYNVTPLKFREQFKQK